MIRPYQPSDCHLISSCDMTFDQNNTYVWLVNHKIVGYLLVSVIDSGIYIHDYVQKDYSHPKLDIESLVKELHQAFGQEDIYFIHLN